MEEEFAKTQSSFLEEQKHYDIEFDKQTADHEEERMQFRETKEMQQAKILDLERKLREAESEYNTLRLDYQKLADLL